MQYPGVSVTWKQASDPMQVPWQYVMLCELCLSAFCAPTTVLFPWNTWRVNPVIWWFLLHPGTFNARLIIYVYAEAGIAIITASICLLFFLSAVPFFFLFPCLFYCSVGRVGGATHWARYQYGSQPIARSMARRFGQKSPYTGQVSATSGSGSQ